MRRTKTLKQLIINTCIFLTQQMAPEDSVTTLLNQLASLVSKTEQVHRIYDSLWKERTDIYLKIIVDLKKGKGFFKKILPDISKDFRDELALLSNINKRERKVLNALFKHKEETFRVKDALFSSMTSTKIGKTNLYNVCNSLSLEKLSALIDKYFNQIYPVQESFLNAEEKFTSTPNFSTLKESYCGMMLLLKNSYVLQNSYDEKSVSLKNNMNINNSLNNLMRSVDQGIIQLETAKESSISNLLKKIKKNLEPYFSKKNRAIIGTFQQRVSFINTESPTLLMSIGLRMAIIAPLLFEATYALLGYRPSIKLVPFKEHPQFYIDFYLFLISYVAFLIDVVPGISQYTILGPKLLLKKIKSKTGSEDPFEFKCF
ncbi:hypothetical protein HY837_02890 [archaeon]|nr:hypothetical protein [archaeon]